MTVDFEKIKNDFINADVDEKIRIYTTTQGLTTEQFRELLKYYPIKHLSKLEKALDKNKELFYIVFQKGLNSK